MSSIQKDLTKRLCKIGTRCTSCLLVTDQGIVLVQWN